MTKQSFNTSTGTDQERSILTWCCPTNVVLNSPSNIVCTIKHYVANIYYTRINVCRSVNFSQRSMTVIDLTVLGSFNMNQNIYKIGKARVYSFHVSTYKHRQKACNNYYVRHVNVFKRNITLGDWICILINTRPEFESGFMSRFMKIPKWSRVRVLIAV